VSVAIQKNFHVLNAEAERRDVFFDQWRGLRKTAVQQDMALRCRDEKRRHAGHANVIDIADDTEWRDGPVPLGAFRRIALGEERHAQRDQECKLSRARAQADAAYCRRCSLDGGTSPLRRK